MKHATAKDLMDAGLSRAYAYMIVGGYKQPTIRTALRLLDDHGIAVPALADLTPAQIEGLRRFLTADRAA